MTIIWLVLQNTLIFWFLLWLFLNQKKGENEEESDYDDSDDEDFDFCTPEERDAYMKEVRENEAACIVIPQEIF